MNKTALVRDPNKFVPIKYDEVFKNVFGNEKYTNITAFLMSVLMNIPYSVIKDNVTFIQKEHKNTRIRDMKCEKDIVFIMDLSIPYKINLEINVRKNGIQSIVDRNLYYFSNLFGNGLKKRNSYNNISTTIQFNFNTFFVDKLHKDIIDEYTYRNKYGKKLSDKVKIVHINIAEMKNLWYNENHKRYSKRTQKIICLGALMMIENKDDFYKCLDEIKANENIKMDIERIVEYMNDNEEIYVRYYDRDEEEERIRRSIFECEVKEQVEKRIRKIKRKMKKSMAEQMAKDVTEQVTNDVTKSVTQNLTESIAKQMIQDGLKLSQVSKYTNIPLNKLEKLIS